MSNTGRFGFFALITDSNEKAIRAEQHYLSKLTGNTIALGFPVHITLKGRFLAPKDKVVNFFESINFSALCSRTEIELSEPKYIGSELSWLEVSSISSGFNTLLLLHDFLEKETNKFIETDEVPENHKNIYFHPHVTLGWGVTSEVWLKYSSRTNFGTTRTQFSHISLACYHSQWPLEESVTSVLKIPIGNVSSDD